MRDFEAFLWTDGIYVVIKDISGIIGKVRGSSNTNILSCARLTGGRTISANDQQFWYMCSFFLQFVRLSGSLLLATIKCYQLILCYLTTPGLHWKCGGPRTSIPIEHQWVCGICDKKYAETRAQVKWINSICLLYWRLYYQCCCQMSHSSPDVSLFIPFRSRSIGRLCSSSG